MKNKLRRMLKTTENEPTASPSINEAQKTTAEQTAWLDRGADILTFEDEWIVRLDHRYALEEKHGHRSYAEVFESLQLPHPPLALDVPLESSHLF